jgi:hypothetical protein
MNGVIKNHSLNVVCCERISRSSTAWSHAFVVCQIREKQMTVKKIVVAMALFLGATPAALAQSAYTTGTIASSEAAGYPSPYGYGHRLYGYAPGYRYGHVAQHRRWGGRSAFH